MLKLIATHATQVNSISARYTNYLISHFSTRITSRKPPIVKSVFCINTYYIIVKIDCITLNTNCMQTNTKTFLIIREFLLVNRINF